MGGAYEVTDGAVKKYYSLAGMTVAMNDGSGLKYLLTDHLGSVVAVADASGTLTSQQRYLPFGQLRTDLSGPRITQTDFGYTGQRSLDMGLMDYHARMYDPYITHFSQPDSIIPQPYNPQSWNRYSYALNNPIRYNDPTRHCIQADDAPHGSSSNRNICRGLNEDFKRAFIGLNRLGVYGNTQAAMELVALTEYGSEGINSIGSNNYAALDQAISNRYHYYCKGGAWSVKCIQSFWGYMQVVQQSQTPEAAANSLAAAEAKKQGPTGVHNLADITTKANSILNSTSAKDCTEPGALCEWAAVDVATNPDYYAFLNPPGPNNILWTYTYHANTAWVIWPNGEDWPATVVMTTSQLQDECSTAPYGNPGYCSLTAFK